MQTWYFLLWTLFFLEITFCGLTTPISIGNLSQNYEESNKISESIKTSNPMSARVLRDAPATTGSDNNSTSKASSSGGTNKLIDNSKVTSNTDVTNNTVTWPKDQAKVDVEVGTDLKKVNNTVHSFPAKETFVLPSKPAEKNYVPSKTSVSDEDSILPDHSGADGQSTTLDYAGTQPMYDEKAFQRAVMVIGGLGAVLLAYLGIKFVFLKKRKVTSNRYGRIESEMDLLDEIEDDGDSEDEDDTLFDVNATRRSQF